MTRPFFIFVALVLLLSAGSAKAGAVDETGGESSIATRDAVPPPETNGTLPAGEVPPAPDPGLASGVARTDAVPDDRAQNPSDSSKPTADQTPNTPAQNGATRPGQQPKRIMGLMPNFRAVSAGAIPPPPSARESFLIATRNSFDYSSFVFVGITSLLAEIDNTHPQLGKGLEGYGDYYWRGFVDKADGNYWVIWLLPTILHEDERYYAMGKGGFWKRLAYSASRVAITPNYDGYNTVNVSELLGRGISQGISAAYYPSQTRTIGALATKYGYAILRDAFTNSFREFWPDIAEHVLHRHP